MLHVSLEWKLGTIILSLRAVKPTHSVKRDAWLLITIQNHLKTIKTYFSQKVAVNESTNKMLHLNSHNIVIIDAAKPHIFFTCQNLAPTLPTIQLEHT